MKAEKYARLLVGLLLLGLIAAVITARIVRAQNSLETHGQVAEAGGWSPDIFHARVGRPVHLRLTSDVVAHLWRSSTSDPTQPDLVVNVLSDWVL